MRLRTARTLLATPSENGVLIYNFLEKVAAECSHEALYWMSYLQKWTAEADILKNHPHLSAQAVSNELQTLTELSVLIIENSAQARITIRRGSGAWLQEHCISRQQTCNSCLSMSLSSNKLTMRGISRAGFRNL
jgi:hypothetical protein